MEQAIFISLGGRVLVLQFPSTMTLGTVTLGSAVSIESTVIVSLLDKRENNTGYHVSVATII